MKKPLEVLNNKEKSNIIIVIKNKKIITIVWICQHIWVFYYIKNNVFIFVVLTIEIEIMQKFVVKRHTIMQRQPREM